jgi:uncharacterized protein YqeY
MSLTEKIAGDLMAAMKAQDKGKLEALRAAKTAFIMARSERGSDAVLTSDEEIKIIQKLVKQRNQLLSTGNRIVLTCMKRKRMKLLSLKVISLPG